MNNPPVFILLASLLACCYSTSRKPHQCQTDSLIQFRVALQIKEVPCPEDESSLKLRLLLLLNPLYCQAAARRCYFKDYIHSDRRVCLKSSGCYVCLLQYCWTPTQLAHTITEITRPFSWTPFTPFHHAFETELSQSLQLFLLVVDNFNQFILNRH